MAKSIADLLLGKIFDKAVETVIANPKVADSQAVTVAADVVDAIRPTVENATNSEPWYRSRIYLGLIAAGIGIALSRFGIVVTGDDLDSIIGNFGTLVEVAGSLYALYGRIVGAHKKPLGA